MYHWKKKKLQHVASRYVKGDNVQTTATDLKQAPLLFLIKSQRISQSTQLRDHRSCRQVLTSVPAFVLYVYLLKPCLMYFTGKKRGNYQLSHDTVPAKFLLYRAVIHA